MTVTCHITVVGGKRGHAPRKLLLLQQIFFKFHGDHKTYKIEVNLATLSFVSFFQDFANGVCLCLSLFQMTVHLSAYRHSELSEQQHASF